MKNIQVRLDNRPGTLASMGEALAEAGISVDGGGVFVAGGNGIANFLVRDGEIARAALESHRIEVVAVQDVVTLHLDQETPGQLGKLARRMATAGVNIEMQYSDHQNRLVLVVDDLERARQIAAIWESERV
jgi:hypothetical protein